MSTIDDLLRGLSASRQRELLEELTAVYNSSSSRQHLNTEAREKYRQLLRKFGYMNRLQQFDKTEGEYSSLNHGLGPWPGVQFFPNWNYTRLLLLRFRRQAQAIANAFHSNVFNRNLGRREVGIGFSILGVVWYLPRLLRHTALSLKHLFSNEKSSSDYFKKYWFQFFNDLIWAATGAITLGIGTGWYLGPWAAALGPGGIILTVALYAFDVVNMVAKAYTKIRKMNRIISHTNEQIQGICLELALPYSADIDTLRRIIAEAEAKIYQMQGQRTSQLEGSNITPEIVSRFVFQNITEEMKKLQQLKDLLDIKERTLLRKSYVKYDQFSKVGITVGLLAGMVLMLTGPIGAAVGAGVVLVTCGIQYWLNHYFLPKKEVQLASDPLELLHLKLNSHVDKQIIKLNEELQYLKNGPEKKQTNDKLLMYMRARGALNHWKGRLERNSDSSILLRAAALTMDASKIRRKGTGAPASYKDLKSALKHFSTPWRDAFKDTQAQFSPLLKDFSASSKVKPNAESPSPLSRSSTDSQGSSNDENFSERHLLFKAAASQAAADSGYQPLQSGVTIATSR
ncbi:hypothetical protein AVI51_14505 [Piscirickettsia salmonis]|uniref:Uncharacterized protein n=1 Tax=Piscirickettsia salmonis TaxID=1238 RepID=A0A9Q5VDV4_PISSA|nr:hypothetical protein [Piscirickettsia salmonis]ALA24241.1 short-chain dehydrogenase [Piscirickettsia salmonis]APS44628.1 hypothetical protein AVI48_09780 [Piscirickettsia salmonis]APS47988.1 hypothetical protein AVI49_10385 [Piscirickettsia salmonis]APS51945.1 hypothetical protein AVI50_14650 [Piscirickettsia salmonis]APS55162.1 hypothetical protein AVI51_14505 [Piscirickettsia salmonis]